MGPRGRRGRGQREISGNNSVISEVSANEAEIDHYDGPSERRGRPGSSGATSGSRTIRASSRHRSASREAQPAKIREETNAARNMLLRNVDFGGNAYSIMGGDMTSELAKRPGFGTTGKNALINVNAYPVTNFPNKTVYQYDLVIGSGDEKRGLNHVVVESQSFKKAVGPGFLFDGNKLGWSMKNIDPEIRMVIDLDAEKGVEPRKGRENKVRVKVTKVKAINLEALRAYAMGEEGAKFSTDIIEGINFMDHLLRQTPKSNLINLRRSYFNPQPGPGDLMDIGHGVNAIKGIYQSLRICQGNKLVINADVSNSCFWKPDQLSKLGMDLVNLRMNRDRFMSIAQKDMKTGNKPELWKTMQRWNKSKFTVRHAHQSPASAAKVHTILKIGPENAKTHKFKVKERETGKEIETTVFDYFNKKYDTYLYDWYLPLVETTKKGTFFPMEVCYMEDGQRFPYKLNETQTSAMIKFAVSRPQERKKAIDKGLDMINWKDDKYLKNYGMEITREMIESRARILDPPELVFRKSIIKPMYAGRWDLKGKVFAKEGAVLKSWGVVVLKAQGADTRNTPTRDQQLAFIKNMIAIYRGHGGIVENVDPKIIEGVPDTAKAIETCFYAAGTQAQLRPQLIVVILANKSAEIYQRAKKSLDCRFGTASQCMQAANVVKNQAQYISNVLMKVHCKLGGTVCTVRGMNEKSQGYANVPTMIIGADVSHPAPGSAQASIAAMTVSMDKEFSRFSAGVQVNGWGRELIQRQSIDDCLRHLITNWMTHVAGGRMPQHVYYFRDGVSEGQYTPMLKSEVADIQQLFEDIAHGDKSKVPKFTVVVAEKRHHIRFFPKPGQAADKNLNPVPGVIVDKDVTNPTDWDYYLCSHAAIQGTARPTHYTVVFDEMKVPVNAFEKLVYQLCYAYQRATTPVSLIPAVYYAHLAASRGISHINVSEWQKWENRMAARRNHGQEPTAEKDSQIEPPALIPMLEITQLRFDMWYL